MAHLVGFLDKFQDIDFFVFSAFFVLFHIKINGPKI
jgi:hypothetical protein